MSLAAAASHWKNTDPVCHIDLFDAERNVDHESHLRAHERAKKWLI